MVIDFSEEIIHGTSVVCAIIERNGRFLAACRQIHQTNGGLWEFPGGKVEKSESHEDALARELDEELGVAVSIEQRLSAVSWKYPWVAITLYPFVTRLIGENMPQPIDHDALRYVSQAESRLLAWAPADRLILQEYLSLNRLIQV